MAPPYEDVATKRAKKYTYRIYYTPICFDESAMGFWYKYGEMVVYIFVVIEIMIFNNRKHSIYINLN